MDQIVQRIGHLKERFFSFDNLYSGFRKSFRATKNYSSFQFAFYVEKELAALKKELESGSYRPGDYRYFTCTEPKERMISVAPFRDRVVHHALVNILEPI